MNLTSLADTAFDVENDIFSEGNAVMMMVMYVVSISVRIGFI